MLSGDGCAALAVASVIPRIMLLGNMLVLSAGKTTTLNVVASRKNDVLNMGNDDLQLPCACSDDRYSVAFNFGKNWGNWLSIHILCKTNWHKIAIRENAVGNGLQ
jgi:hypothetical protein